MSRFWPIELPAPISANFKCQPKQYGDHLVFQSGRSRVFRNRTSSFLPNLTIYLTFRFTPLEYEYFLDFYNLYWKEFANQYGGRLTVRLQNAFEFRGWVPGDISTTRNANSWDVSFYMECTWAIPFLQDWGPGWQAAVPELPSPLNPTSGTKIDRISRDITIQDPRFNLQRTVVSPGGFVNVSTECQIFDMETMSLLFEWYCNYTAFGAKTFKIPVENLDIGSIGGVSPSFGYYGCKFLSPPTVSFRGSFGTAQMEFSVFVPAKILAGYWTAWYNLRFDDASADLTILDSQNILSTDVKMYDSEGALTWVQ